MKADWFMTATGHICRGAGRESMEESMPSLSVRLVVFVLGLGMLLSSPADAQQRNRQQRANGGQWYGGGVTVMPRNTPESYVVCWNGCGHPGSIVMGADPDPFIRSQILRDASPSLVATDRRMPLRRSHAIPRAFPGGSDFDTSSTVRLRSPLSTLPSWTFGPSLTATLAPTVF
jgi:hypothetical protein